MNYIVNALLPKQTTGKVKAPADDSSICWRFIYLTVSFGLVIIIP